MNENSGGVNLEERFLSGPWIGFFRYRGEAACYWMHLDLTFQEGIIRGTGTDDTGPFVVRGRYFMEDGRCLWSKRYVAGHDVFCTGYNEGKGIWGPWACDGEGGGGFHIWPAHLGILCEEHIVRLLEQPWVMSLSPELEESMMGEWLTE